MGTRSYIGAKRPDGSVRAVYCHWDGYPEGAGKTLRDHYSDPAKVEELLALGDISVLGEEIGEKQDFNRPAKGTCIAYGRDRGEAGTEAVDHPSEREFAGAGSDRGCEYLYTFSDGFWSCSESDGKSVDLYSRASPLWED
jgi:hypothetical protein